MMKAAIAITTLLLILACGGAAPTATPEPMTVTEYAEVACAQAERPDNVTWGQVRAQFQADIDRTKDLVPPETVRDYHFATIAALQGFLDVTGDFDEDAIVTSDDEFPDDPDFFAKWAAADAADAALDPKTRQILWDAGCTVEPGQSGDDAATPVSGPTGGPVPTTPPTPAPTSVDRASGTLSLEEFGVWCQQFEELPEPETWDDAVELVEHMLAQAEGIRPPAEVEEYYRAWRSGIEVIRALSSRQPADEPLDFAVIAADADFQAASGAVEALLEAMPTEIYDLMGDCF